MATVTTPFFHGPTAVAELKLAIPKLFPLSWRLFPSPTVFHGLTAVGRIEAGACHGCRLTRVSTFSTASPPWPELKPSAEG